MTDSKFEARVKATGLRPKPDDMPVLEAVKRSKCSKCRGLQRRSTYAPPIAASSCTVRSRIGRSSWCRSRGRLWLRRSIRHEKPG